MKYVTAILAITVLTVAGTALLLADGPAAAGGPAWTEDMSAAMAQAKKEGKDLLVDFTGSDWCGWCIKLDREVFTQEPFATEAPKHFVLVKLDFPRRKQLSAETKKQNARWQQKLGVQGFPTIYLLDDQGRPFAKTGYRQGGPEAYMAHLNQLRQTRIKRDAKLAAAEKASGVQKAKLLDEALSELNFDMVVASYRPMIQEILKLDAKDTAGLKTKYQAVEVWANVQNLLAKRDYNAAVKKIDGAMATLKPTGQVAQDLLLAKGDVLFRRGDKPASKIALEKAIAAEPKGNKVPMIQRILKQYFK